MERLHRWIPLALVAVTFAAPTKAQEAGPLEIRFHPTERLYAYEVAPERELYSLVLQHVAVVNQAVEEVTVESVRFDVSVGDWVAQSLFVSPADLDASAARMKALEEKGVLKMYDFHFQTSRLLGPKIGFASTRRLAPRMAVTLTAQPFLVRGLPDRVSVSAVARGMEGREIKAQASLRIARSESAESLRFPLLGTWYVGTAPDLAGHHRWAVNQEFALDLVILDGHGQTHSGTGERFEDYYAFGREVLAMADGTVVEAASDEEESEMLLPRAGESQEEMDRRGLERQQSLLAASKKAPLGNYVVIRHSEGKHSLCAHLRQGSVSVRPGDAVRKGQVIGRVGQSGNSDEPHLHVQVTDGPDPLYSRGIPMRFENLQVLPRGEDGLELQTGWFVSAK